MRMIYPLPELVFNAFKFFSFKSTKIILLGQDPYINFEIHNKKEVNSPNIIKVVKNTKNELIYFSRSKIPESKNKDNKKFHKQVCIYCFSKKQLEKFSKSKRSSIEKTEDIELLRFLDLDIKIKMCKVSATTAVDVPNDLKNVEKILKKN